MRIFLTVILLLFLTPSKADWKIQNAIYRIDGKVVNVRADSSITSKKIGQLKRNQIIEAVESSNDWAKISYRGKDGFIYKEYLSLKEPSLTIKFDKADISKGLFLLCFLAIAFFLPRWILLFSNYLDKRCRVNKGGEIINIDQFLLNIGYPNYTIYTTWLLGRIARKTTSLWVYKLSFIFRIVIIGYFLGNLAIYESLDQFFNNSYNWISILAICLEGLFLIILLIESYLKTKWFAPYRTLILYIGSIIYPFSVLLCSVLYVLYSIIKWVIYRGPAFLYNSVRLIVLFIGGVLIAMSQGGGDYWRGYNDGRNDNY